MNKFYEIAKRMYNNLRGSTPRRTFSKTTSPSFKSPSEFYDNDGIELGAGAMVSADSERVIKGIEKVFDVPEGEVVGVDQEAIINYWEKNK